jgi:hypothetical protein
MGRRRGAPTSRAGLICLQVLYVVGAISAIAVLIIAIVLLAQAPKQVNHLLAWVHEKEDEVEARANGLVNRLVDRGKHPHLTPEGENALLGLALTLLDPKRYEDDEGLGTRTCPSRSSVTCDSMSRTCGAFAECRRDRDQNSCYRFATEANSLCISLDCHTFADRALCGRVKALCDQRMRCAYAPSECLPLESEVDALCHAW